MAKRGQGLLAFGFSISGNDPPEKKQLRVEQKQQYEKGRSRKFLPKWKDENDWLHYDDETDTMFCVSCREYADNRKQSFVVGTNSFRVENITSHGLSTIHLNYYHKYLANKPQNLKPIATDYTGKVLEHEGGDIDSEHAAAVTGQPRLIGPMDHQIKKINKEKHDQLVVCFNTAFFVAKKELPFTLYPSILELQEKNGLKIPQSYRTDQACRRFIKFIHEDSFHMTHEALNNARVLSVMFDGATDTSTSENEIVYARAIFEGVPTDFFVKLEAIENANAAGVFKSVDKAMTSVCDNWKDKVVGMGSDGAKVNIGKNNSVATHLQEHANHLIVMHCIAHRLELGASDAMRDKDCTQFTKLKDILQKIHKHYYYSPKAVRELKCLAEIMDVKFLKPGNLKGTRWMAYLRGALKNLTASFTLIVAHFENTIETRQGIAEVQGRAKFVLKYLKSYKLLRFMFFLQDIFQILSVLSLEFQKDGCTLPDATGAIETASLQLVALTQRPGENLQSFLADVSADFEYRGVKLNDTETAGNVHEQALLDAVLEHICFRVDDSRNRLLKSMQIFFPVYLPSGTDELAIFGEKEISILCTHFSVVLDRFECDIKKLKDIEWPALKTYLQWQPSSLTATEIYRRLFCSAEMETKYHNILMLVEIVLCIPVSSSVCERGFSTMARIKSDWRSTLTIDMLNNLMGISISGTNLDQYDADKALNLWWYGGDRERRPQFDMID